MTLNFNYIAFEHQNEILENYKKCTLYGNKNPTKKIITTEKTIIYNDKCYHLKYAQLLCQNRSHQREFIYHFHLYHHNNVSEINLLLSLIHYFDSFITLIRNK